MPIEDIQQDLYDREQAVRKLELEKLRSDLATLQTRLNIGEITPEAYLEKSKALIEKISILEKEVNHIPISLVDRFRKNRALFIITAAVIFGLLLCVSIVLLIPRTGTGTGNVAPDFVMQLGDDSSRSLSAFRGKNVILVFWDRDFWDDHFFDVNGITRKLYTPEKLNQLYQKSQGKDLAIIAVASGAAGSDIDHLVSEYQVAFPVIGDTSGKLRSSYNVNYEPTTFIIDKNGIIRARVEGPITTVSDYEQLVHTASTGANINPAKPPISDVLIQAGNEKSAIVNWSTSQPTTTQVDIDGKNIETVITAVPTTLHSINVKDLSPATAYHIRILYNVNGVNVSEHSFSALADTVISRRFLATTAAKDSAYPDISGAGTGFISDSSILVTWKTDEPASGEVDYSYDRSYNKTASQGSGLSIWHTVKIDNLLPDTQYFLRIRSRDASGKEASQDLQPAKTQSSVEIGPAVGKRAPDFTLTGLDGTKYSVGQFRGRKLILNLWLEGCKACEAEMPLLQAAYNKYSRDEVALLAVNVPGDESKVRPYVAREKLSFPVLLDSEGKVDSLYKLPAFPTTYFIDAHGIIRGIQDGRFQTESEIDDALGKLDCNNPDCGK